MLERYDIHLCFNGRNNNLKKDIVCVFLTCLAVWFFVCYYWRFNHFLVLNLSRSSSVINVKLIIRVDEAWQGCYVVFTKSCCFNVSMTHCVWGICVNTHKCYVCTRSCRGTIPQPHTPIWHHFLHEAEVNMTTTLQLHDTRLDKHGEDKSTTLEMLLLRHTLNSNEPFLHDVKVRAISDRILVKW